MEHLKKFRKLNRTTAHRKALYRNMVEALIKHKKIETTLIKAKEIRRVSEKIITKARVNSLHNIRIIGKLIKDKDLLKKLFTDIAPLYVGRNGGYTRIIRLGKRKGDGADMAFLELITDEVATTKKKKKKKKEDEKVQKSGTVVKEKAEKSVKDEDKVATRNGKVELYKDKEDKFRFRLKAGNGEIIAVGESFTTKEECLAEIDTLKKIAVNASIVDLDSDEEVEEVKGEKFEIYTDKSGEFRFRLKSDNGSIVAVGEGYKAKQGCLNGIESIKKNVVDVEIKEID